MRPASGFAMLSLGNPRLLLNAPDAGGAAEPGNEDIQPTLDKQVSSRASTGIASNEKLPRRPRPAHPTGTCAGGTSSPFEKGADPEDWPSLALL